MHTVLVPAPLESAGNWGVNASIANDKETSVAAACRIDHTVTFKTYVEAWTRHFQSPFVQRSPRLRALLTKAAINARVCDS